MKILFICLSNICRSPYCEYVFKKLLEDYPKVKEQIEWVRSSAVLNKSKMIHPNAVLALRREGFDDEYIFSHKPSFKWLDMKRYKDADVIVGMAKMHKCLMPLLYRKKYVNISEFAGDPYMAVKDPYLKKDIETYYATMDTLKSYLVKYLDKQEKMLDGETAATEKNSK